jgi:Ca2+/H+ antiporter, TMEM165/GDT1 family
MRSEEHPRARCRFPRGPRRNGAVFEIVLTTFGAVLVAEIGGDKLLYTTGVLAMRYRSVAVATGMALAFMCKMAVAVAVGAAVTCLPRPLVAVVTGASFVGVAFAVWATPDVVHERKAKDPTVFRGAMVAFAAILFSEWGDIGQVTAAGMAARFVWSAREASTTIPLWHAATLVWSSAVAAMVAKGMLAALLGNQIRLRLAQRMQPRVIRGLATAALVVLGILAVLETLGVLVA